MKNNNSLFMVFFSAPYCGPCKTIKPIFVRLSKKYKDCMFLYLNLDNFHDKNWELTDAIKSIPQISFYHNGAEIAFVKGANKDAIIKTFNILQQKIPELNALQDSDSDESAALKIEEPVAQKTHPESKISEEASEDGSDRSEERSEESEGDAENETGTNSFFQKHDSNEIKELLSILKSDENLLSIKRKHQMKQLERINQYSQLLKQKETSNSSNSK